MSKFDADSVGSRIRIARCSMNLTQKKLADEVGVGSNYIAMVEGGKKHPSEELIYRIAGVTHTTSKWIFGTSENQTPYPEPDGFPGQINGDSATIAYLIDIIRGECASKEWEMVEPQSQSKFPNDWLPDYWFSLKNGPIKKWAFDLSLCVYYQPSLLSKNGRLSPGLALANFVANVAFSNPMIRNETKYTLVVPNEEIFFELLKQIPVSFGNLSIMQIGVNEKKIVQEKYLCNGAKYRDFLENTLRF